MYKISLLLVVYKFGNEVLNGNCSVGQLTNIGFEQQIRNGKALREAYVSSGFLSPNLTNTQVYIRSDGKFMCWPVLVSLS